MRFKLFSPGKILQRVSCDKNHTNLISTKLFHRRLFQNKVKLPRAQRVVSFYDEEVAKYGSKHISPVTLQDLVKFGKPPLSSERLIASAQYTLEELPPRLARRVLAFQSLPYIVGINPHLASVYQLYYDSFELLRGYPKPVTPEDDAKFAEILLNVVHSFADVIPRLAQGFRECQRYMSDQTIQDFLDGMIRARIGIRLIAEQHLALHQNLGPEYVGILHTSLQPGQLFLSTGQIVEQICEINYGRSPKIILDGHQDAQFQYCPVHLEYIAIELLKNAFRATAEFAQKRHSDNLPPVIVTVAREQSQVCLRISDQGGGIPPSHLSDIFRYSFTTVTSLDSSDGSNSGSAAGNIFDLQAKLTMQAGVGGPMAGLGYGLPMTRIYAQYFGGNLEIQSLEGYGTDVYLTLPNIQDAMDTII